MEEYQHLNHIMKCAAASMGEWGSHATTSSTIHGAQRSFHGATSKPSQVKEENDAIMLQARIHHARPAISTTGRGRMEKKKKKINNDAFNFGSISSFLYFQLLCKFCVCSIFSMCVSSSVCFKST
jgi:hypothetical protein